MINKYVIKKIIVVVFWIVIGFFISFCLLNGDVSFLCEEKKELIERAKESLMKDIENMNINESEKELEIINENNIYEILKYYIKNIYILMRPWFKIIILFILGENLFRSVHEDGYFSGINDRNLLDQIKALEKIDLQDREKLHSSYEENYGKNLSWISLGCIVKLLIFIFIGIKL